MSSDPPLGMRCINKYFSCKWFHESVLHMIYNRVSANTLNIHAFLDGNDFACHVPVKI